MVLLETKNLTKAYGGVVAVNEVSFQVQQDLITGLIGPNGAGKTTLFNNITGLDNPTAGKVFFEENDITNRSAHNICRMGIALLFHLLLSNLRLFYRLPSSLSNCFLDRFAPLPTL
jgi:branched-chain amino acid transport system ATP-binding protein